jgi:hypothetical protein
VNDWDEEPVLVSDVEFVHGPNGKIPSTVRLYLAYGESGEVRSESAYLQVFKRRFKVIKGGMDRKLAPTPIPGGSQAAHRLKPCVIEGALKIMNGVPDYGREVFEALPILDVCEIALDEFVSTVRIYMSLTDKSFFQAVDATFNIRDVFVGPFDLETCTFKKFAHASFVVTELHYCRLFYRFAARAFYIAWESCSRQLSGGSRSGNSAIRRSILHRFIRANWACAKLIAISTRSR